MEREIKFKFHFDNHAPVILTLMDLITGDDFFNLYRNNAGMLIAKRQFTGLKDKNGKDIYEGDILADSERKDWDKINFVGYEVFYHDNDCCEYNVGFQMNRHHFYGSICGTSNFRKFIPKTVSKMEVIGNIHEHPELLKQLEK